jgi:hypothetical protein
VNGVAVASSRPESSSGPGALLLVGVLGALGLALDILTDGNFAAMLAAVLVLGVLVLAWFVPLRWSLLTLLFLGLTLEAPYESFAGYLFRTPWHLAGTALLGNLNLVTHVAALKFTGFDVLMIYLLIVHAVRRARGSTIDGPGFVPLPRPLLLGALVTACSILLFWAWGLSRGGNFSNSLWQLQKPLYGPLLLMLLHAGFRGSRDMRALGLTLVAAAVYRAALAVYIRYTVFLPNGEPLQWATTHADSVLFVAALMLLVILRNERVAGLGRHWLSLPTAAIVVAGMVCNGRRLAWVMLAGALLVVAWVSPWTPWKRRAARAALLFAPLACGYLAAGWESSGGGLYAPVAVVRSVIDSRSDSSSLWRDRENTNLVLNIGEHLWTGVGFGHEYIEYDKLDDISGVYPQFRYNPHNSVLGLFTFTGAFGVPCVWALLIATVFLAARSYRRAFLPEERAGAMMCIVIVFLYVDQAYGDIGVSLWISPLTLAPAAMLAGKLALSTGAWPWPRRAKPAATGWSPEVSRAAKATSRRSLSVFEPRR